MGVEVNGYGRPRGHDLVHECGRVCYSVGKRFGVDPSYLRGKLTEYVVSLAGDHTWLSDEEMDDGDYESRFRRLRRDLSLFAEREARRVRAAKRGYSVDDEVFYPIGYLKELLEVYFSAGLLEHPPVGFSDSVRHEKADGSDYGNFLTSLLDIEIGLGKISTHHNQILRLRYGFLADHTDEGIARLAQSEVRDLTGWHWEALRATLGASGDEVASQCRRALKALQRALGGSSPWHRDGTLEALMSP